MVVNLPKSIQEEVSNIRNTTDFSKEGKDVNPEDADSLEQKSTSKETLKLVIVEFIFLPISLIAGSFVHGAIHLLHYHHIYVLSYLILHLFSWLSSSLTKNIIRRLVTTVSIGSIMGNFLRQYV